MARATEPERRLLAVYTGGTIGMRSEGGGECPRGSQPHLPAPRDPGLNPVRTVSLSEPDSNLGAEVCRDPHHLPCRKALASLGAALRDSPVSPWDDRLAHR